MTLDHHDLNLGEGSPVLVGEVKGILGLDTKILMRFSLLKTREATTAGKAKVERCPSMLWSKPNLWENLWDCRFEFRTHLEIVPKDETERHKKQKRVLP